jgi:hypothetical protein
MFYIITYATHSSSYFEILKQSCPDIIVLGWGTKWTGFGDKIKATVEFCKTKKPDDIVCFVDGFDSIILSSKEEILEKYKSFNIPLIISQSGYASSIIGKYLQDKFFGKCNKKRLNSGLFIGTTTSIIDFWKDMQDIDDDQRYATQKCNKITYMNIDTEHKIFYNYSPIDKFKIKNNSLYINNNTHTTSIISAPANNNINHILFQLNYKNLPDINYDVKYRILTYGKHFINEAILAIIIIGIFVYLKNIFLSISISLTLILVFLEYDLFLKHYDISNIYKFIYLFIDFIHIIIIFILFYLIVNIECNIQKLLLLNVIYFTIVLLFLFFKSCILNILNNKIINSDNHPWTSPSNRIEYFFYINQSYENTNDNINNTLLWINGNRLNVILILLLNMYCLWKISSGNADSCIPKAGYNNNFLKQINIFKKKVRRII